jgi:PAP2 superfamily
MTRGRQIWDLERALHLPSERSTQQLVIHHRLLVHWLNEYYVQVHVPALGILLVWLFVRHRDRYPKVRNVVAMVTGACLLIQMFPVAPPRLLPHLGIIDTGAVVGPSTYAGGAPGIDQLSAMPSMHVAWALIVGGAVIWVSKSRYRWLALLYPIATTVVVVLTGNHYWADAIVAAAVYLLATQIVRKAAPIWTGRRADPAPADTTQLAPVLVTVESAPPPDRPARVPTRNVPTGTLPTGTLNRARPHPSTHARKEPVPLRDSR